MLNPASSFKYKLVDLEASMLHVNFQDHMAMGSGEADVLRFSVFTIYGRGGHLDHVTWTIYTNLPSPFPWRLHVKFGCDWRRRSLKMVDDDGRTPGHGIPVL